MPYELHIRRRSPTATDSPISRDEWLGYLERDPEFKRIDGIEGINPMTGATIQVPGDLMAEWTARGDPRPPFNYFEGRISVPLRGRDDAVMKKMKEVAAALDARVFGDEGEEY